MEVDTGHRGLGRDGDSWIDERHSPLLQALKKKAHRRDWKLRLHDRLDLFSPRAA